MADVLADEKAKLRGLIAAKRRALTPEEAARRSVLAQERLLASPLWKQASSLALYVAAKGEISTDLLLREAWAQGKSVFLPKVETRPGPDSPGRMSFALCSGLDELRPGAFNILEPIAEPCASGLDLSANWLGPNRQYAWPPALFVLPGLAFDRRGRRLGWGGGYYDSFLADRAGCGIKFIGLAYAFQLLEDIPAQEWDVSVNAVCTDEELLLLSNN
ncbi:MAG: 5-formyltetrahydrofolate cyclo-ligase [Deltaproteobacteria bacterium]|jgi:5-formyltetrahydrofolate cyclo-ligase|nr:5-formyltetrahydrofolate cyclo-ligase [Deltaproteobacteria bacterium]